MSNSEKENTDAGWLGYFLALAVGAFVLCVFYLYGVSRFFCDWTQKGLFGDSFGALNSFFSGLALAGVIITVYLQSRELRLQRKEMRGSRDALREQAKKMENSSQIQALGVLIMWFGEKSAELEPAARQEYAVDGVKKQYQSYLVARAECVHHLTRLLGASGITIPFSPEDDR